MRMKIRRGAGILLLAMLCMTLSGCRVRTGIDARRAETVREDRAASGELPPAGTGPEEEPDRAEESGETGEDAGGRTKENPEASRKEYDENAPVEIIAGMDRKLHGEGEGDGAGGADREAAERVNRLNGEAEETATQVVAAEQAEKKGTAEDAEEAESAATYFTVLLQERTGSLYECQRQNVYWETKEDHVTVYRTSGEHRLILDAGAYDVSSRLLEENLRVDDGWICRKDPGVIVKITDRSVLGTGVAGSGAAQALLNGLLTREGWAQTDAVQNRRVLLLSEELLEAPHLQKAAALLIAKTANPELFSDTDPEEAIRMLQEEAAGGSTAGLYYYIEGGFR